MSETAPPPTAIKLHCLAGGTAPPEIGADLDCLRGLPSAVKARFWEVLGPCLAEPLPPATDARLNDFCRAHDLDGDDLARAIKACRFLIRSAAALDLSTAVFGEDLCGLSIAGEEITELLLPGYQTMKGAVRGEIIRASLVDHGKVLVGVDWRVDIIADSSHGRDLCASVALVTLRYTDSGRAEQITLQATPESLRELRRLCDRLLGS